MDNLLGRSLSAYAQGQLPEFEASLRQAQAELPCVSEAVDATTAANLHLAEALLRKQAGTDDAAAYRDAWRMAGGGAARSPYIADIMRLEPEFLGSAHVDVGVGAADTARHGGGGHLAPALSGELAVDGRLHGNIFQSDRPYVFQRVWPNGRADAAQYLRPGDPPPKYPRLRPVLLSAMAGGAALSAVGFLTAFGTEQELVTRDWSDSQPKDLSSLQTLNQAAFITGVSAGAIGLGAGGWLAWSFR